MNENIFERRTVLENGIAVVILWRLDESLWYNIIVSTNKED